MNKEMEFGHWAVLMVVAVIGVISSTSYVMSLRNRRRGSSIY